MYLYNKSALHYNISGNKFVLLKKITPAIICQEHIKQTYHITDKKTGKIFKFLAYYLLSFKKQRCHCSY